MPRHISAETSRTPTGGTRGMKTTTTNHLKGRTDEIQASPDKKDKKWGDENSVLDEG